MPVKELSQIAAASSPPSLTDTVIGVLGGTTDQQFTLAQMQASVLQGGASNLTLNGGARVQSAVATTANDEITITDTVTSAFPQAALHVVHLGTTTQPSPAGMWIYPSGDCSQMIWNNAAYIYPPNWSSSTAYAQGDAVVGSDTFVYTSQVSSNANHNPVGDGGSHWVNVRSTVGQYGTLVYEDKTQFASGFEFGVAGLQLWLGPTSAIGGEIPIFRGLFIVPSGNETAGENLLDYNSTYSQAWSMRGTGLHVETGQGARIVLAYDIGSPGYNIISLNGFQTDTGNLGWVGGPNDSILYHEAPAGGGHHMSVGPTVRINVNDTDMLLTPANGTLRVAIGASVAPVSNGELIFQATSNTSLTFKYKGSDGTVRSASLTLS
jgi:hypothetical protein